MPHPIVRNLPGRQAITDAVLGKVLLFLTPLYIDGRTTDIVAAWQAASSMILSYGPETDQELRLVALIIALGFGALDALSRAAQQNQRIFDGVQRLAQAAIEPAELAVETSGNDLPPSSGTPDLVSFARTAVKAGTMAAPPVSATNAFEAALPPAPLSR